MPTRRRIPPSSASFALIVACLGALVATCGSDNTPAGPSAKSLTSYSLAGTVTDASGKAIADARVSIVDPAPNPNAGKETRTDSEGRYALTDLALQNFSVSVGADGYRSAQRPISLTPGVSTVRVEFVLAAAVESYVVTGRVTNTAGAPVAGATIAVADPEPNPNAGKSTTSDGSGVYRLAGLTYGTLNLSVTATGYLRTDRSLQLTFGTDAASADFTLTTTVSAYAISGTVRGEGGEAISNAMVLITDGSTGPNGGRNATTDRAGSYRISNLIFSTVNSVSASANGYKLSSRNVPMTAGTEVAIADFVLARGLTSYTLQGTISSQSGSPIDGAKISVVDAAPNPNAGHSATTNSSGGFAMTGLALANFSVSVTATGYDNATRSVQLTSDVETTTLNVTLTATPSPPAPSPPPAPPAPPPPGPGGSPVTIGFDGVTTGKAPYSGHSEKGFTIAASGASWYGSSYGTPGPAVDFDTVANSSTTGQITITGDGRPFVFSKMNIYSSLTTIPWSITGKRNGAVVYQSSGTQGHTFGDFATVTNSSSSTAIDRLEISITNTLGSGGCPSPPCTNPVGIDSIVVSY